LKTKEEYEQLLGNQMLLLFSAVEQNSSLIDKKYIHLENINELIKFANTNSIKCLFYTEHYISKDNFYISEEIVNKALLQLENYQDNITIEDLQEYFGDKVDKYNDKIDGINFERPYISYVYCIYETYLFGICEYDLWFEEIKLLDGEEAIMEIINDNEENINKRLEKKKIEHEKLVDELRGKILMDHQFNISTNQRMRTNYIYNFARDSKNGEYFTLLMQRGVLTVFARNLIEILWKEYKSNSKL